MTAKVYNHNRFHNSDSEPVAAEGYVDQYGTFVPDNIDDLLPVGGTCHDEDCLWGPWCSLLAELPDGTITAVV